MYSIPPYENDSLFEIDSDQLKKKGGAKNIFQQKSKKARKLIFLIE